MIRVYRALLLAVVIMSSSVAGISEQQTPELAASPKGVNNAEKLPEFDVASVKENRGGGFMWSILNKPDGFSCTNTTLKTLVGEAYGVKQDFISGGPGWLTTRRWDINAKVSPDEVETFSKLTSIEHAAMLQPLLAKRFHLKTHAEPKLMPVYELVVMKDGPKLRRFTEPSTSDGADGKSLHSRDSKLEVGPNHLTGERVKLSSLATQLSYITHRTVLDKTGLDGEYTIDLKWAPEDIPVSDNGSDDTSASSIFTAVREQLGLRLQHSRAILQTIVVDTANPSSDD